MFNYNSLVSPVRMLLGDAPVPVSEETPSFQNDSYKIVLGEEGIATVTSVMVNGGERSSDSYKVEGNIITFDEIISAGSSVSISYRTQKYTDQNILEYIENTIFYYIQALTNRDYGFGQDGVEQTSTLQTITSNESSLFVHGTVLNIIGVNILQASDDAIFIKDGDTTIDTKVASQEAANTYKNVLYRFNHLFKTVRTNTFQGTVIEGA